MRHHRKSYMGHHNIHISEIQTFSVWTWEVSFRNIQIVPIFHVSFFFRGKFLERAIWPGSIRVRTQSQYKFSGADCAPIALAIGLKNYLSKCKSMFSSPEFFISSFFLLNQLEIHSNNRNSSWITRSLQRIKETRSSGSILGKSIVLETISKLALMKLAHKLATWLCPEAKVNWYHDTTWK